MSPRNGRSRPRQGGSTTFTTTDTEIKAQDTSATITALASRKFRVTQARRRTQLERQAAEAIDVLVVALHGDGRLDDAIFAAHRILNLATIDLCRHGEAS